MKEMKKILLVLILTCLICTSWVSARSFEEKVKSTEIPVEISVSSLSVEELLERLSEQSGINIKAVPEVACK